MLALLRRIANGSNCVGVALRVIHSNWPGRVQRKRGIASLWSTISIHGTITSRTWGNGELRRPDLNRRGPGYEPDAGTAPVHSAQIS